MWLVQNSRQLRFLTPRLSPHTVFKYFTLAEANEALPKVRVLFDDALQKRKIVEGIQHKMQEAMAVSQGGHVDSATGPLRVYVEIKQELNDAMLQMYGAISALEATGVSLKGLEPGMVDFPSKRFDDDVWLCWKYGEDAVKFWHEMDAGFMGRKPVDVSDESLV